jgi:outer membrane protein assembly factor BamA
VLEVRYPVYRAVKGVVFFDAGNLWYDNRGSLLKTLSIIDFSDMRFCIGAGLRVKLPIGTVRCDAGLLLNRRKGESAGAVHLDIGQAF